MELIRSLPGRISVFIRYVWWWLFGSKYEYVDASVFFLRDPQSVWLDRDEIARCYKFLDELNKKLSETV